MATVTIKRVNGQVVFDPPSLKLDPTSDFVIWSNEDPDAEHQPVPAVPANEFNKPPDYWIPYPLPRFVAGQPAATSPAVNFTGYAAGTEIEYVDGLSTKVNPGKLVIGDKP